MKLQRPRTIRPARWTRSLLELLVLSIRQPYAWLVVNGVKDIENRSWRTHYRGRILIHASANQDDLTFDVVEGCEARARVCLPREYDIGGIVDTVEIVDCVRRHPSVWKDGPSWGWVLANARPLRFRECKGAVGFFYSPWR